MAIAQTILMGNVAAPILVQVLAHRIVRHRRYPR